VTGRRDRSNRYIGSAAAALLLGLSCSAAIADIGPTDSAADMKAPATDPAADKVTSPALADTAEAKLSDSDHNSDDSSTTETDAAASADDLPDSALSLPGISEKELPRFRRQMYRTDI